MMFNNISNKELIKTNVIFLINLIFFCLVLNAQNLFAQKDAGKGELTISATPIEPQSLSQQSANKINSADNRHEENEYWKKYLIEEASNKMVRVDVDSIYLHYARNRKYNATLPDFFAVKIIPHQSLMTINKISKKDTVLFGKVLPANKYFSTLIINNEKDYNSFQNYASEWDALVPKTTFSTSEIINSILPPYIVTDKSMNAVKAYAQFINNYFTMNPEVVYFCSSPFLNMLAKQQYEKIMSLHLNTSNSLNLVPAGKEKK
jgi:hypothetical protein